MVTLAGARGFLTRVVADFRKKNVTFMAAGLAYNAFISLAPILLLLFLVLSSIGGGVEERIVELAGRWLPGPIAEVVRGLFEGETSAGGASFIGLVVLGWGMLKIFRGLDTAFSEIYETEGQESFVDKLTDGVVVLVALVVAIVATVGTSAVFAVFAEAVPYLGTLSPLILVAGLVLAFFPIYYVFPDTDVGIVDVLPGVVFAAVGWAAFQGVFQVYLTFSDPGSGSFFGGVIVVVTYLYFSALVLLAGAVINAVLGDHSTGKPGGVGEAATDYESEHEESMNRDELAVYLQGLREDVAGHYERMRPRTDDRRATTSADDDRQSGSSDAPQRPRPDGDVTVTEHSNFERDRPRWTVTLEWDIADEDWKADHEREHATGESDGDRDSDDWRE